MYVYLFISIQVAFNNIHPSLIYSLMSHCFLMFPKSLNFLAFRNNFLAICYYEFALNFLVMRYVHIHVPTVCFFYRRIEYGSFIA